MSLLIADALLNLEEARDEVALLRDDVDNMDRRVCCLLAAAQNGATVPLGELAAHAEVAKVTYAEASRRIRDIMDRLEHAADRASFVKDDLEARVQQ